MYEITAKEAAEMSRDEALRMLATAEGVDPAQKRLAEIMLEGPTIEFAEEARLRVYRPSRSLMFVSVHAALAQLGAEIGEQRAADAQDLRELAGAHG